MLTQYKGNVTVKIDGIAASAASVIAMAGNTVLMSPVSMMMIHNPATVAFGDHAEMQKAIDMLAEVKESIINAYVIKTGLTRAKLSHLMDAETWMDANKAVELGFADDIITRAETKPNTEEPDEEDEDESTEEEEKKVPNNSMLFSRKAVNNALMNKLEKHYSKPKQTVTKQAEIPAKTNGTSASEIKERLNFMKKFI
ncbi:ATP-dependent Clp protease proteolytic subunit 1 [uncultured Ruminococcus sp.]|nr:ATP-dependent Clp protease proteolytic subunit 1 [uncultured Ruminococcus sp.]